MAKKGHSALILSLALADRYSAHRLRPRGISLPQPAAHLSSRPRHPAAPSGEKETGWSPSGST